MIRRNMAPYIADRLQCFKKGFEGLNKLEELFVDFEDPKVKIADFEFKFNYHLNPNNLARLNIEIVPLSLEAKSQIENVFLSKPFTGKIKYYNLVLKDIKVPSKEAKNRGYIFRTELISIHDKATYGSVFEHFVKPLVFKK